MRDLAATLARWKRTADGLVWSRPPDHVFVEEPDGHGRWFPGGELDLVANTVDRHAEARPHQPAIHWEGEPGDRRTLTYRQLQVEVDVVATALHSLGIGPGDRIALHLGLTPEAVVTMLACARLRAVHAVLPAVLPPEALAARLHDLAPRLLVTQDGAWRHGVVLPLKVRADEALTAGGSVEHTLVVRRAGIDVPWYEGDRWWHELLATPRPGAGSAPRSLPPAPVPADHPYLVAYVANRRGAPTGLVHGTAGLLAHCLEMHTSGFGLGPGEVLWVPAELGWVATQTHGILGPLTAGGTAVVYEGMLDRPHHGRAWEIIQRYQIHGLVMTPSVARALHRWADRPPTPEQVASLRVIVTAGEPIDTGTAAWLASTVGGGRVHLGNGWGLSELGGAVVVDPPVTGTDPPDPGLEVVDASGDPLPVGEAGELVLAHPWPSATLRILDTPASRPGRDPARPGVFATGDRARRRDDGSIDYLGRIDRVFSVSGQLVSATEIRTVLEEHPFVARAEVVDRPDPRTGRAVVAWVALTGAAIGDQALADEFRMHVHETLGGLAQPQAVAFVDRFPVDVEEEALHRALQALSLTAPRILHVTEAQLAAARSLAGDDLSDGPA